MQHERWLWPHCAAPYCACVLEGGHCHALAVWRAVCADIVARDPRVRYLGPRRWF